MPKKNLRVNKDFQIAISAAMDADHVGKIRPEPLFLPPDRRTAFEVQFFDEKEKVFLIAPNASVSPRGAPGRWISMITQKRPAFSVMV
jgi:hypothetical protein